MPSKNSNKTELRESLDRALKLQRAGRARQAARALEKLALTDPDSPTVVGLLGNLYLELGELEKAVFHLRRATALSPKSELASVGFFHSLWESELFTEALREMQRFLRMNESPEYAKLLRDLAVEGRLVPQIAGAA